MKHHSPITIFWFRRDLRLHDNHGLFKALTGGRAVLPVFIFDKNILGELKDKKDKRVDFIRQSLERIKSELERSNSSLLTFYSTPEKAFEEICKTYNVAEVITNHDYEPYAIERDEKIRSFLKKKEIAFNTYKDQVIFEKTEITKADKTPYTIFTPYSRIWKQNFQKVKNQGFPSEKHFKNFISIRPLHFHSLKEIGFTESGMKFSPSKTDKNIIKNYHLTRNIPALDATTHLSVHLRFGTVSVRQLAKAASELNEQWLNELIWREFFMMILFNFPDVVTESFKKKYDKIKWRNNEKEFALWCKGETGYPIVDAGMRELNETGFMHNRVRMIVASFLCKHLLIDWRWGEAYFAEKLLDYDLSANNGNWQWSAGCGCDAAPYFRVFNPHEQIKKFDPDYKYIKKWIKNYKPGYLPEIVEHTFARKRVLATYKNALV
ncbi:MAG: cryptochrome/photolyase family protein [Bacteroidia bacterium]